MSYFFHNQFYSWFKTKKLPIWNWDESFYKTVCNLYCCFYSKTLQIQLLRHYVFHEHYNCFILIVALLTVCVKVIQSLIKLTWASFINDNFVFVIIFWSFLVLLRTFIWSLIYFSTKINELNNLIQAIIFDIID